MPEERKEIVLEDRPIKFVEKVDGEENEEKKGEEEDVEPEEAKEVDNFNIRISQTFAAESEEESEKG